MDFCSDGIIRERNPDRPFSSYQQTSASILKRTGLARKSEQDSDLRPGLQERRACDGHSALADIRQMAIGLPCHSLRLPPGFRWDNEKNDAAPERSIQMQL